MMLLNLIVHLIGILFIEEYIKYESGSFHFFGALFFISIYAVFQVFVFPVHKKYRIYIIPVFVLLLALFILYNDIDGYGSEILHSIVCVVSRIICLIFCFVYDITNETTRYIISYLLHSLGYSLYLLAVFSLFKYIMKCISKKYSFFALNNKPKIKEIDRENQL
jgi:hypothetical protein